MKARGAIEAQRAFRALLRAASRPGELCELPDAPGGPGERLLRALLDQEVSFCAGSGADPEALEGRLCAATGARIAPLAEADFVLLEEAAGGSLPAMKAGTLECPEEGATAVRAVRRLGAGGLALTLSGPGVPGERELRVDGLDVQDVEDIRASRVGYPLGVDLYLVDESGRVAGLPRSTRVAVSR